VLRPGLDVSGAGPVVGVSDLLRQPGGRREVRRTLESPGYRGGSTEVPEGADVDLDLVLETTADPGTLALARNVRAPSAGEGRRQGGRWLEAARYAVGSPRAPAGADADHALALRAPARPGARAVPGLLRAPGGGEGRRCLERVEGALAVGVRELFSRAPEASS